MSEQIEGRNAVMEAFRSGQVIDKLFILDGCQDGPVRSIAREARKKDTIINYVPKERLDQLSQTGSHQGMITPCAPARFAVRMIAPRLCGSSILSSRKINGGSPFSLAFSRISSTVEYS